MKLCFDSIDEVQAFVKQLKGTRGKKGEDDNEPAAAPVGGQPTMPPAMGFTPPQTAMQGFPGAAPAAAAVNPLVPQIIERVNGSLSTGQSIDNLTGWFRGFIGPDAANATLDQIKEIFLPRLSEPQLKQLAQQVGIAVT